jgi:PhoPQ-activated pathogenicity-related protein
MKDKNQISALLGVCIIPQIIAEIKQNYNNQEEIAIKEFYKSNLFEKLQNPNTGMWHLSAKTLSEIYLTELKEKIIEFPEEQS